MIKYKFIKFIFILFFLLNSFYLANAAASTDDSVIVNLNVENCNHNNICELGEDYVSCPSDCTATCNNNTICEPGIGETTLTCPSDCSPTCNHNNICETGEDIVSCPSDCSPIVCNNNNICESPTENINNCPADCTPIITPPTPPGGGDTTPIVDNYFQNVTVVVSYNSVIIKWTSSVPTTSSVKWGTSQDYKDGIIGNINYLTNHQVEIKNLKDGTDYFFSIKSANYFNKINILDNQIFKTLKLPDTTPPGNPTNVKIKSDMSGVTITWNNPDDIDFDYVRVMRNLKRFYGSPFTGHLVYEGKGNYLVDSNVINNTKYYYTLFSRDKTGNYSSGTLVSIVHNPSKTGNPGTQYPKPTPVPEPIQNPELTPDSIIKNGSGTRGPRYTFTVIQGSSSYDFRLGSILPLSGDESIDIKTNYVAKSINDDIWVEIINTDREIVGSYFFSRTRDEAGYTTVVIPPFEKGGYYSLNIFRYVNDDVTQIINQGAFKISKIIWKTEVSKYYSYAIWIVILIVILFLFLLWLIFIIIDRIYSHFHPHELSYRKYRRKNRRFFK